MNYGFQSLGFRISEAKISGMRRSLAFLSQSVEDGSIFCSIAARLTGKMRDK